jgi:hypothetical protein
MKQRQVVQLYKQSYTLQIQAEKMSKMEKTILLVSVATMKELSWQQSAVA